MWLPEGVAGRKLKGKGIGGWGGVDFRSGNLLEKSLKELKIRRRGCNGKEGNRDGY